MLQCYIIPGWLNSWIPNHGYLRYVGTSDIGETWIQSTDYKIYTDFPLRGGSAALSPALFKGQLYMYLFIESI